MEVKKAINRNKLREDFDKVRELKHQVRRYCWCSIVRARELKIANLDQYLLDLGITPEQESKYGRNYRIPIPYNDLEPRFYYFAYTTEDWTNPETICQNIADASSEYGVHLHGLLILDKGLYRRSAGKEGLVFEYIENLDDAFALFMHSLIDSLMTFVKIPEGTSIPLDIYQGITEQRFETFCPVPSNPKTRLET